MIAQQVVSAKPGALPDTAIFADKKLREGCGEKRIRIEVRVNSVEIAPLKAVHKDADFLHQTIGRLDAQIRNSAISMDATHLAP